MFDALERKWRHTDQSDLINQLYQGKMKDYVKCLAVCILHSHMLYILYFSILKIYRSCEDFRLFIISS